MITVLGMKVIIEPVFFTPDNLKFYYQQSTIIARAHPKDTELSGACVVTFKYVSHTKLHKVSRQEILR